MFTQNSNLIKLLRINPKQIVWLKTVFLIVANKISFFFIKGFEVKISKNGKKYPAALFFCDFCKKEVKKGLSEGQIYKSCGCYRPRGEKSHLYEHGLSSSKLHALWRSMMCRCHPERGDIDYIKKHGDIIKLDYMYYLKNLVVPLDQMCNVAFKNIVGFKADFVRNQYLFQVNR